MQPTTKTYTVFNGQKVKLHSIWKQSDVLIFQKLNIHLMGELAFHCYERTRKINAFIRVVHRCS